MLQVGMICNGCISKTIGYGMVSLVIMILMLMMQLMVMSILSMLMMVIMLIVMIMMIPDVVEALRMIAMWSVTFTVHCRRKVPIRYRSRRYCKHVLF